MKKQLLWIFILLSLMITVSAVNYTVSSTKKDCDFKINPEKLDFYQDNLVLRLNVKNNENITIIPKYIVNNDLFEIKGEKSSIVSNSEQELSIVRLYDGTDNIEEELIIISDTCFNIVIPISYTYALKQSSVTKNMFLSIVKTLTSKVKIFFFDISFYVFTIIIIFGTILLIKYVDMDIGIKIIISIFIILLANILLSFMIVPQTVSVAESGEYFIDGPAEKFDESNSFLNDAFNYKIVQTVIQGYNINLRLYVISILIFIFTFSLLILSKRVNWWMNLLITFFITIILSIMLYYIMKVIY